MNVLAFLGVGVLAVVIAAFAGAGLAVFSAEETQKEDFY